MSRKFANETIRYDVLHGRCAQCDGPVYFTKSIDWEGNRVNAFHCWNGHYDALEIEHFSIDRDASLTPEQIEEILPFVGFVKLPDEENSQN